MALLCAAEPDCIVPIGSTVFCVYIYPIGPNVTCHRQDMSVLGTVRYNMEYRKQIEDPSFVGQLSPAHPRSANRPLQSAGVSGFFRFYRRIPFNGTKDEWLHKVRCGRC
ncbi:hypothetical protein niasHS_005096 [Heterodera schachtii]|uniref:Uncharacterized protein n=2 Tax=Heterodera TaxID=34509 RepID=A0ABD2JLN5_HETSC